MELASRSGARLALWEMQRSAGICEGTEVSLAVCGSPVRRELLSETGDRFREGTILLSLVGDISEARLRRGSPTIKG